MGLGVFRPTDVMADIVIYSKWCVKCQMPKELQSVQHYAMHKDLSLQVIRTAYRPADHKRAAELWPLRKGAVEGEDPEDYKTFVLFDGKVQEFKEYVKMIERAENKMVKKGRTKSDLQGLPKAKRSSRADSLAGEANETENKA